MGASEYVLKQRARITKIAEREFPQCTILFDERSERMVHFEITSPTGARISRTCPCFYPSEIENRTDEELSWLLRSICEFPE